jgi:hypothetical protein
MCFDALMRRMSWVMVLASGVVWLVMVAQPRPALGEERADSARTAQPAQTSPGDAALRGLLQTPRVSVDPGVAQLEALMAELSEHPLAKTAGKPGLDRARAELTRLRALIDQRADAQAIARKKQIVWAALSSSDRQMARAELAVALQTAIARRERAEAQLKAAKLARDAHRVDLDPQAPASAPEVSEPPK